MLTIRAEQLDALSLVQIQRLKNQLFEHIHEFWSDEAVNQGKDGVSFSVDFAIERADFYTIEEEYDIFRYVNLMYALGNNFDSKIPWAKAIIKEDTVPISKRIDKLHARAIAELETK